MLTLIAVTPLPHCFFLSPAWQGWILISRLAHQFQDEESGLVTHLYSSVLRKKILELSSSFKNPFIPVLSDFGPFFQYLQFGRFLTFLSIYAAFIFYIRNSVSCSIKSTYSIFLYSFLFALMKFSLLVVFLCILLPDFYIVAFIFLSYICSLFSLVM